MNLKNLILSPINRSIIDSLNSGLILFNPDREIILYNKKAPKTYFFRELPEYEGESYRSVFPETISQAIDNVFDKVLNGLSLRIDEMQLMQITGQTIYIGATLNPLTTEQGEVSGVIMNGNNITRYIMESKERQELKELNERLSYLLEQFKTQNHQLQVSNIRNEGILETIARATAAPLMVIINSMNYLHKLNPNPNQNEYLNMMEKETQALMQINEQIIQIRNKTLDFNRLQCISLESLIQNVLSGKIQEIRKKDIEMQIGIQFPEIRVQCIPDEITEAVSYIIDNSILYNRFQGKITISDRIFEQYYFITIEDTGYGIHPDDLPSIFMPFFRGRNAVALGDGMGLNLSLARNIIEKHNGTISIESRYEQKTTVTFYLETPIRNNE